MKIIIDLENTISNSNHRMHLLKTDPLRFQEEFINDTLNENIKYFIESWMKKRVKIIILTAKSDIYKNLVIHWLKKNFVHYDKLIMKNGNESNIDFKEKYAKENKDDILMALDDVGSICEMYSKYDIPCLRIVQNG